MKKKSFPLIIILLLLTFFAFFWRLKWWPNYVTFGFEQARDALAAQELFAGKKLTLIGPTTEIEGIFHGPLYYYLIGLPYSLFGKNPASVSLLHILVNITTIPIIFWVGKSLFDKKTGLIAAFLFAISYEVASYSLWLSNPSPGLPFIILAYFFLYRGLRENQKYYPLAFFLLGIAVQFDLIVIMHLISFLALYFIYQKPPVKLKNLLLSGIGLAIPLINYPLFEIRHDFLMTRKFLEVLAGQDGQLKSVFSYLAVYLNGLAKEFANVLFPIHGFFAGLLMFALLFYLWQKLRTTKISKNPWALLIVWLFSALPTFLIVAAVTNSEFSFFGANAAIVLLAASFINGLLKKKKRILAVSLLLIIFLANLRAWNNYFPNPQRKLFDSQKGVILNDLFKTIDYTYEQAGGKPFFIDAVTVPLYISPLWDYLYSWHGQAKFGYLPTKDAQAPLQFLIIEPGWGETYEIFTQKAISVMDQRTKIEEEKNFGWIKIQKRFPLSQGKPQE